MIVTVKGVVLSIKEIVKNEKKAIDVMLYQDGENTLVRARFSDLTKPVPKLSETVSLTGALRTWSTQGGGVGSMVSVAQ